MHVTILSIFTVIAIAVLMFIGGMIILSIQGYDPEDFIGITKKQLNITLAALLTTILAGTFIASWMS